MKKIGGGMIKECPVCAHDSFLDVYKKIKKINEKKVLMDWYICCQQCGIVINKIIAKNKDGFK
jgi:C4-type Zn-finger protein